MELVHPELHAPRLHARQVEHVVDEQLEILGAPDDRVDGAVLRVRHLSVHAVAEEAGVAEHRVERRPELVRHRRQKARLRLRRLLELLCATIQAVVRRAQLGAQPRVLVVLRLGAVARARKLVALGVHRRRLSDDPALALALDERDRAPTRQAVVAEAHLDGLRVLETRQRRGEHVSVVRRHEVENGGPTECARVEPEVALEHAVRLHHRPGRIQSDHGEGKHGERDHLPASPKLRCFDR